MCGLSTAISFAGNLLSSLINNQAFLLFAGAFLSILATVLMEWYKRPRLKISIDRSMPKQSRTIDPGGQTTERYKGLRVLVQNEKRWPRWWPMQTLVRATARVSFHDVNTGRNLFEGQMRGRWASLQQPEEVETENGRRVFRGIPSLITSVPEIDIPWGETEALDVAVRFENETDAYGFSNENYYDLSHRYRAERWKLPWERCLVRVTVRGSGEKATDVFRIENRKEDELTLQPATKGEKALVMRDCEPASRA